jgi:hypothetical protein
MHVECPAKVQREVVIGAVARRDRRPGDAGHPSCRQGGARPCQWIRLGWSISFSTRTRKGVPTSVLIPNVPSGWRMPKTEADFRFTPMVRVAAAAPSLPRPDETPGSDGAAQPSLPDALPQPPGSRPAQHDGMA